VGSFRFQHEENFFYQIVCGREGHLQCGFYGGRVEELARESALRGRFDFVVSRAMANPFICSEMGAPLLKRDSFIISIRASGWRICRMMFSVIASKCGLEPAGRVKDLLWGLCRRGCFLRRSGIRRTEYPRRFSVLLREGRRFEVKK
jgi:hypothetical protein